MRVISGDRRGFRLKGPPSRLTRPMSDKIREALFSSLQSLGVEPRKVLDLYAGTGSIGIEALSRGARQASFVDRQKAACSVVQENLDHTKFSSRATVYCQSLDVFLTSHQDSYDLIIMDPPYADPDIEHHLTEISFSPLVQSDSIVVLGHWPRLTISESPGRLALLRRRCHGDSCFSVFEIAEESSDRGPDEH
ncbi:16S rRNA (guanine(966)-N(2))-methyltransferase RsmD [soil metagenome]